MAIGRYSSWIINTSTVSKQHFLGTMRRTGLTGKAQREASWKGLAELVLCHASKGA